MSHATTTLDRSASEELIIKTARSFRWREITTAQLSYRVAERLGLDQERVYALLMKQTPDILDPYQNEGIVWG